MGGPLTNAGTFLISTLFGLYLLIVMLRFLFQYMRIDFYNPISQFLLKATNPILRPLRRIIPGAGGIDWSSVILMLSLKMIETLLVILMMGGKPSLMGIVVISIAGLLSLLLSVFLYSILISVIISWVAPSTYNPMTSILHELTEPVLRPARKLLPAIGGLDLSPLLILIGLQLLNILFINPLTGFGWQFIGR